MHYTNLTSAGLKSIIAYTLTVKHLKEYPDKNLLIVVIALYKETLLRIIEDVTIESPVRDPVLKMTITI